MPSLRKLCIPLAFEFRAPQQRLVLGSRTLNQAQIGTFFLALFQAHEVQAVAHHLNQAQLCGGLGVHRLNNVRQDSHAVHAGHENVGHFPRS